MKFNQNCDGIRHFVIHFCYRDDIVYLNIGIAHCLFIFVWHFPFQMLQLTFYHIFYSFVQFFILNKCCHRKGPLQSIGKNSFSRRNVQSPQGMGHRSTMIVLNKITFSRHLLTAFGLRTDLHSTHIYECVFRHIVYFANSNLIATFSILFNAAVKNYFQ